MPQKQSFVQNVLIRGSSPVAKMAMNLFRFNPGSDRTLQNSYTTFPHLSIWRLLARDNKLLAKYLECNVLTWTSFEVE